MLSKFIKPKRSFSKNELQGTAVVISDDQQRLIALGLTWRVMVAGGNASTAKRMAVAAKASHFCVIDGQTTGLAIIPGKFKKNSALITPAATIACKRFGGDGVFALRLSNSEVWFFVMRNGLPTGSELVIQPNKEDGDSAADIAMQMCADAVAEFATLIVYSDLDVDFGDFTTTSFSLKELTGLSWTSASALVRVVNNDKTTVPVPILVGGAIALCAYAGWSYYSDWAAAKLAEEKSARLRNDSKADDPVVAWKKAIQTATSAAIESNNAGVELVRASIAKNALPAKVDGWRLKVIACTTLPFQTKSQMWKCSANYVATEAVDTATNLQLKGKIPAVFNVTFLPVTKMTLSWEVTSEVKPLDLSLLPERSEHLIQTASKIQPLLPALTTAPNFAFAPINVLQPLTAEKKIPIPKPVSVLIPVSASIKIEGPMRSVDAALAKHIPAQWNGIAITIGTSPSMLMATSATLLKQSAVTAVLTGTLYAKQ